MSANGGTTEVWEADAIVFAVGVSAMQRIVAQSPLLGATPQFAGEPTALACYPSPPSRSDPPCKSISMHCPPSDPVSGSRPPRSRWTL